MSTGGLPGVPVHLFPADEAVRWGYGTSLVALCGELVGPSELPPSMCTPGCEGEYRYCGDCVREATRWNAETERPAPSAEQIITQLVQLREQVARDGG